MTTQLIASLTLFLTCSLALAQEACEQINSTPRTVAQMVDAQMSRSQKAILIPDPEPNKCFPRATSAMVGGAPLCYLNFANTRVPVMAVMFGSTEDDSNAAVSMHVMRGTKMDVDAARAYFDQSYPDATEEYLKEIKGPRFHGPVRAWKNAEQYIVLGQDEPGYNPVHLSLSLIMGSKEGLRIAGIDLNTCK